MNLRQAAEMALKYFEDAHGLEDTEVAIKEALRQALDLQTAIERGTKAWADVPDATKWVEELRDNTPDCKTHPDAPHGFDRNASHSADRYVCECEGWEPPKREWVCCVCGDPKALGIVHSADAPCFHYTKREWVGLTKEDFYKKDDETVFVLGMKFAEARLKEKNT